MKTFMSLATGALVFVLSTAVAAARKDSGGYVPDRAAQAASLPVYVLALNERLLPQMSYGYQDNLAAGYYPNQFQNTAGLSAGQSIVAGALGSALGAAIANAKLYADAKSRADAAYYPLKLAQCDFPVETSLQSLVREAIARSKWGADIKPASLSLKDGGLDKQIGRDQPRQIFIVSSSLAPDLTALVTSLEITAYAPEDDTGKGWQKQPLWRDELIVVSDRLQALPAKSAADIERMVADEQARYDASGVEALVRKVNAEGRDARRADRQAAMEGLRLHANKLRDARSEEWSLNAEAGRRAQLWSANGCAPLRAAFDQSSAELSRMIDALYAQELPPRLSSKDKPTAGEVGGERKVYARPGGSFVSRNEGGITELGFRYVLLPLEQ